MFVKGKSARIFFLEKEASKLQKMIMTGLGMVCIFGKTAPIELNSMVRRKKLETPFVVGAVIHLGYCFDMLESHSLQILQTCYFSFKETCLKVGLKMPINKDIGTDTDKLLRKLDCAVFEYMHNEMKKDHAKPVDSIIAAFWEGKELYPTAGFNRKEPYPNLYPKSQLYQGLFSTPQNGYQSSKRLSFFAHKHIMMNRVTSILIRVGGEPIIAFYQPDIQDEIAQINRRVEFAINSNIS